MTDTDPNRAEADDSGTDRADAVEAVVCDVLPNGRPDDRRGHFESEPLAFVLGVQSFELRELVLEEGARVTIGDRLSLDPPEANITEQYRIGYDDLSGAAQSELEYAVEEIIEADEPRFVEFFNDAQGITTRLHSLNLLPGIGNKLRNDIIDERRRGPFVDFEDLEERIGGLHRPREVLRDRIVEELRDDDLKYRIWADPASDR